MTIALFKVVRNEDFNESENGLSFTGKLVPATPEEIRLAHGKCGTCSKCKFSDYAGWHYCSNADSPMFTIPVNPDLNYCNHHEPKEA